MNRIARRLFGAFQPVVGVSALVERCENDNRLVCDLVRQRPRKATQGHLPDSHAPCWSTTTGVPVRGERLARFTVASTTSRKRAPRPLGCRSYQSSASAISPAASGWNSTRTLTAAGGCRQPVRAPGPSQRSRRPPTRPAPSGATTHRATEFDIDRVVQTVLVIEAGQQFHSEFSALIHWKGQQYLTQGDRSRVHGID